MLQAAVRLILAAFMVGVGVMHFVDPEPFVRIVPPYLPAPAALVAVSGVFEVLGGIGLLVPWARRFAGLGLVALFVAVFPANVYMATHGIQPVDGVEVSAVAAWGRLPLQLVLIWIAWWTSKPPPTPVHLLV
jgi:uncharacterized membrane protein